MFGRNKNAVKPDLETYATYCGGHKLYPKDHTCKLKIYGDHVEITKPELSITFKQMTKVDYSKESGLAMVGLLAVRKNQTYTIIEYHDGNEPQKVVLLIVDQLGSRNLEKAQGMLYQRMLDAKNNQT